MVALKIFLSDCTKNQLIRVFDRMNDLPRLALHSVAGNNRYLVGRIKNHEEELG